jgi:hypothetical protein
VITFDLIGPLPESQGNNAILVIVDWMSKAGKFIPTHLELTAEGFAKLLRDNVFRNHGLPLRVIHDRDPRFVARYLKELFRLLGIEQNPSTAYHPQTDGQTERVNQTVEQYLRIFVNDRQNDWSDWLPMAEFSYNNSIHSATHQTPFFINTGQHPRTGTEMRKETRVEAVNEFVKRMKRVHEETAAALRQSSEKSKNNHDRHARPSHEYAPGDQVYLEATNLKTDRPMRKLDDKRFGPFKVKRKVGRSAYELDLPAGWPAIHPVFNESLLTPYHPPSFASQRKPPPPPPILDDEDQVEYEAESIRDSRRRRGRVQYLVHWRGYPREDDTWEPVSNLRNSPRLVQEFHTANPHRPSPSNGIRTLGTGSDSLDGSENDDEDLTLARLVSQAEAPSDPRLYNEFTGQPGSTFALPRRPQEVTDIIMPITTRAMDLIESRVATLNATDLGIPATTKRLWLYETKPVSALTFVAILDPTTRDIARLYQSTDPINAQKFWTFYRFKVPAGTMVAPQWLPRDASRHRVRVW